MRLFRSVTVILFLLSLVFFILLSHGTKFNLSPCEDYDCDDGTCTEVSSSGELLENCREDSITCVCVPTYTEELICDTSDTCEYGSACMKLASNATQSYCVNCVTNSSTPLSVSIPPNVCPSIMPSSQPPSDPENEYSSLLQQCSDSIYCDSQFDCATETNDGTRIDCDSHHSACTCLHDDYGDQYNCENSDSCAIGDRCVKLTPNSKFASCVPCDSLSRRLPTPIDINGTFSVCTSPAPTSRPSSGGDDEYPNTLEECTDSCANSNYCRTETNSGKLVDCDQNKGCTCLDIFRDCENSDSCAVGQHCIKLFPNSENGYCVPCGSTQGRIPTPLNETGSSPECPSKIPSYAPTRGDDFGKHLNLCESVYSCSGLMTCHNLLNDGSLESCSVPPCFCLYTTEQCKTDGDCNSGEGCFRFMPNSWTSFCIPCDKVNNRSPPPIPADNNNQCGVKVAPITKPTVPASIKPSPSAGSGRPGNATGRSVCIAAHALTEFTADQLVFKNHERAAVLCDNHDNCATPGHMIIYRSRAMMMKTYCQLNDINCRKTVTLVNSVRMHRGIRIISRSNEFRYTTFAAAYESWVEEKVIALLVRMGI